MINMSYRIYSGDKKSLVFPIMGDGYVHLDYSKHIPHDPTATEEAYGLWGHKSSFTIEGIVTPYDINGFGWLVGQDYGTGGGDATSNIVAEKAVLGLPFNDKYFSAVGNADGASSRSLAYFSHEHVGYLAEALDNSETIIDVSRLEDLDGRTYIRIDNEKMEIKSTTRNKGNGYQVTVDRGHDGTTAVTHDVNAPIYTDNRKNHKMSLFYNANCEFYLKNMTRGNMNQPAEYKIGCIIKGKDSSGNTRTVTTESINPVITADEEYYGVAVEQPALIDSVFGKPVFLETEDRVKHHKMVDVSGNQLYFERRFNGVDTIADTSSNNVVFENGAGTIVRASGNWTSSLIYIKVVGSPKNDGYYKVRNQSGGTITVDANDWVAAGGTNTATNLITDNTQSSGALKIYYTTRASSSHGELCFSDGNSNYNASDTDATCDLTNDDATVTCDSSTQIFVGMLVTGPTGIAAGATVASINTGTQGVDVTSFELSAPFAPADDTSLNNQTLTFTSYLDMVDRVWRGRKLYGQLNSTKTFSTSLEQKDPIYLGYIDTLYAASNTNYVNLVDMAACKLIKPVRTTAETTLYVDDARDLSVTDTLRFFDEVITITAISGNTLTVTRGTDGSTARTSKIDAWGGGDTTPTDYYIDPLEEYNFSRTLYKILPSDIFSGFKLVDGSGDSITNSDNYGGHLLAETWKEASYVLRPFHLAMSYDTSAKRIILMVDGKPVDTQTFSEGELTISSIVGAGNTTVTINTNGLHGLAVGDWISIDDSLVTNLDGVWQLPSQTVGTNSFTITTASSVASATTTTGTLKDVTIRTALNFEDFEFDATDCHLGSNGSAALETRRASQFMGEIHEFSIAKGVKDSYQSLDTLIPNFRNTLLYFRFEGENS